MEIRIIGKKEYDKALELAYKTFLAYEAIDYSKEGIEEFYKSINDEKYLNSLKIYGAYQDNLLGIIATRKEGTHIALFFVDGKYHNQGIGKKLFEEVKKNTNKDITVNSSRYAIKIYEHLGFTKIANEKETSGIRYTEMIYKR